jgi:N-glycosylase/DNA lyase
VLKTSGLLGSSPPPSAALITKTISRPLCVGRRVVRYRFIRQRSERLAKCLALLASTALPSDPLQLREALRRLPGVGLKTASWIVRNHTGSDRVAIIDVHVYRACTAAGLFDESWQLPRDYLRCEEAFLAFATAGGVSAAALDACIWEQMHELGRLAPRIATVVRASRESGWAPRGENQSLRWLDPVAELSA